MTPAAACRKCRKWINRPPRPVQTRNLRSTCLPSAFPALTQVKGTGGSRAASGGALLVRSDDHEVDRAGGTSSGGAAPAPLSDREPPAPPGSRPDQPGCAPGAGSPRNSARRRLIGGWARGDRRRLRVADTRPPRPVAGVGIAAASRRSGHVVLELTTAPLGARLNCTRSAPRQWALCTPRSPPLDVGAANASPQPRGP